MRPESRRLNLETYPFAVEVPSRFSDMDLLRHLNNVAVANIYEEGRVRLHERMGMHGLREKGSRSVIAQITIKYLDEGFYPEPLTVGGGVTRVGRSSYEIGQGLFQKDRCIGTAETVIVYTRDGASAMLPDAIRDVLTAYELTGG